MFDHTGYNVSDLARSRAFCLAALAPLGHGLLAEGEGWTMIGRAGSGRLWIGSFGPAATALLPAWTAQPRAQVDAFHQAALGARGRDNGPPGLQPRYAPGYTAAFVLDPDGHNVEAVCNAPD